MSRILVVDDKADIRDLISDTLREEFQEKILCAHNIQTALEHLKENPKVVILDIWLEGSHMDGIGLLKIIKNNMPNTQVIMISGHGNIDIAVKTIKLGAYDFIEKPFKAAKLLIMVERAIEKHRLLQENDNFKNSNNELELIGNSKKIIKINQMIDALSAQNNSRVIISGAAGTGKLRIAKAIHRKSPRRDKPFFYWQVSNKSEEALLEEMLGNKNNPSMFEYANGGVICIDELIGMPLSVQSKLLYMIQSGVVEELDKRRFEIRFLASTKHNIRDALSTGSLIESFYYSFNIATIEVPALCERQEDIPILTDYFLETISRDNGSDKKQVSDGLMDAMMTYNWPGNIRQLKNSIEWMVMLADNNGSSELTIEMLPTDLSKSSNTDDIKKRSLLLEKNLKEAKEIFERDYIIYQLKKFEGNISKTASFIGMDRTALHRKIKALNIFEQ